MSDKGNHFAWEYLKGEGTPEEYWYRSPMRWDELPTRNDPYLAQQNRYGLLWGNQRLVEITPDGVERTHAL
jgi:hypothetical protein